MRVILKSAGIFSIAFLTGAAFYYSFSPIATNVRREPAVDAEPVLSNVSTERLTSEIEAGKLKAETELKIFNVENVSEEDEKPNRDFVETGDASNLEDFRMKTGETWF